MKPPFLLMLLFFNLQLQAQNNTHATLNVSPLSAYSEQWNRPEYIRCNTAANVVYMSVGERNVIYVLNLVRANPRLFASTVLKHYPERTGQDHLADDKVYFQSLLKELQTMKPLEILLPDKDCYTSALCHATQAGMTGYVGHERKKNECRKKMYYNGECCDYGNSDPLEIVLSLLIDEGIPSLGHRSICLGQYGKLGVSLQPHKTYTYNTVMDFHF